MSLATTASGTTALPVDAWFADRSACELRAASYAVVPMLAHGAVDFVEAKAASQLGFSRLCDHTRECLDRSDHWLHELVALGRAITASPQLERALLGWDGAAPIGRVTAEHLARVATPESMDWWIRLARTRTVRQLAEATTAVAAMGAAAFEALESGGDAPEAQPPTRDARDGADAMADAAGPSPLEAELGERFDIRFDAPEPVQAAFYDTCDVYRAISGYEATVRSFWDAIVAETCAGPFPPDVTSTPLRRSISTRVVEHAMARATRNWAHLEKMPAAESATVARATEALGDAVGGRDTPQSHASNDLLAPDQGTGSGSATVPPDELERRLRVLIASDDAIERRLGDVLHGMSQRNDWATLGFRSLGHYATERLGMPRSTAYARVAVVRELKERPLILEAYREGQIHFEPAQVLADILKGQQRNTAVDRAWIEHARETTVKRLRDERLYYRRQALYGNDATPMPLHDDNVGCRPRSTDAADGASNREPARNPRSVRMPLPDAVWDQSLRRAPGDTLDRLARLHLPGEDPTVPTFSVLGTGGSTMRFRLPAELANRVQATLEAARQRVTEQMMPMVDDDAVDLQTLAPSRRGALIALQRGRRVPTWVGLLALLEDFAATWDNPAGFPQRDKDAVYERAGFRCQAPGCTRRCNIEDHHLVYRSHQGSDQLWNQLCLCRFHHHQGEHGFFARCRGRAPLDVLWRLGVEESGVFYRNERRV